MSEISGTWFWCLGRRWGWRGRARGRSGRCCRSHGNKRSPDLKLLFVGVIDEVKEILARRQAIRRKTVKFGFQIRMSTTGRQDRIGGFVRQLADALAQVVGHGHRGLTSFR